MIRTTYPDRICYRPGCDDRECHVLLPEGVRIGKRAAISPGCIISEILLHRHSTRMSHMRIRERTAIPPGCITFGILLRRHSTRKSHIRNSSRRHSIQIFCIRRLMPDERGRRFNFSSQTYPDPLTVPTRRVSQPFCTVPRCSPETSRYVRPTF